MRTFGQVFGLVIGLFGIIFDVSDIITLYRLINTSPLPKNLFDISSLITFVFVVATLMIIGGFYIFVQSRK
jgi:hypothetical protein